MEVSVQCRGLSTRACTAEGSNSMSQSGDVQLNEVVAHVIQLRSFAPLNSKLIDLRHGAGLDPAAIPRSTLWTVADFQTAVGLCSLLGGTIAQLGGP